DLVRSRVFAEKGLVRPTQGRVVQAQRRAAVGYGLSIAIAAASLIGCIVYLASSTKESVDRTTAAAIELSRHAARERGWELPRHLEALAAIDTAIREKRDVSEEIWNSTREDLKRLYAALFDQRTAPRLRVELETATRAMIDRGPKSFDEMS